MRHPCFDEMKFRLNDYAVEIETTPSLLDLFSSRFSTDPSNNYEYQKYVTMGTEIREALMNREVRQVLKHAGNFCPNCGAPAAGGKFCTNCGSHLNRFFLEEKSRGLLQGRGCCLIQRDGLND